MAVKRRYIANDLDLLDDAVLTGLGIGLMPLYQCSEPIKQGRLVRVLPDWCSPAVPLHAVYPSTRHLSPKVKVFLDLLHEQMNPPPWEEGPAT